VLVALGAGTAVAPSPPGLSVGEGGEPMATGCPEGWVLVISGVLKLAINAMAMTVAMIAMVPSSGERVCPWDRNQRASSARPGG
jgi:hypothetical protein